MNASEIVDLLLEADGPSAGNRSGVYVFGPNLPDDGYPSAGIDEFIEDMRRHGLIPKNVPDNANMLDQLVDQGYVFVLKKQPGDIEVIGKKVPIVTTPEGADNVSKILGLEKHDAVSYRAHSRDSSKRLLVDYVLYGSKEKETAEKEKAAQAKAQRVVPSQAFGEIDPEEEGLKFPAHGVGYSDTGDMQPIRSKLEIGVTFDLGSRQGIAIREVHPGGPAAQAGIRAGDVMISTGKFASTGGRVVGPYYTSTVDHLLKVLNMADPQYAIPFKVRRGDRDQWLPVLPVQRKVTKSGPDVIPAAQVQQYADQQASGSKPQAQQQQQARPAQMSMARQLFAGQPKQVQKKLPLQPNEKSPARKTGNPPANVSSVT